MTFNDILKSDFLNKAVSFSLIDTIIAIAVAFAIGLYIFIIYKKTFNGVMYSASFGLSLIAMDLITTLIILAITSNVILSLGMVGALSIVRFRTAIKDPMDIVFLFWAIAAGIMTGAGLIPLAVLGSAIVGIILLVFANRKTTDTPYMLLVNCVDEVSEQLVLQAIEAGAKKRLLKAKTVNTSGIELTVEVRLKDSAATLVNDVSALEGVSNACLVSYNGDYLS